MAPPAHLCRLCNGRSDNIKIFVDNFDDIGMDHKIYFSVNIKVHKTDSQLTLCTICRDKVQDVYEFKTMCLDTESQHRGKKDAYIPNVKIKQEPSEESETVLPSVAPSVSAFGALPNAALMYPLMLDHSGNLVQMPMVPVGNPIPYSAIPASAMNGALSPFILKAGESQNQKSSPAKQVCVKKEELDIEDDEKLNQDVPDTLKHEVPEPDDSASSEDSKTVDDIINEVSTEKEDESENTKSSTEDKCVNPDNSEIGKLNRVDTKVLRRTRPRRSSEHSKEDVDSKDSEDEPFCANDQDSAPIRRAPIGGRARRGRKRRGSSLRSLDSTKRRRSGRNVETPTVTTPENEIEPSSAKRLTRSSAGKTPRRRIVDSDSDDGDFDPDDPDDPEYSLNSKRRESSSSSDSDEPDESHQKKSDSKKDQLLQFLKSSKAEKEEATKKSCPHCQITYKHWVSYDDHTKTCAEEKRLENEKLAKEKPKPVEKEEDDHKQIKCIICLEMFVGSKALREHMAVHQTKKGSAFECKTCHEAFADKGGLICHNALKHRTNDKEPIMRPERKKLYCLECDESFQNSGDYICHQVLHHKKK